MKLSEFDYGLPEKLIAQFPLKNRVSSKMLALNKKSGQIDHKKFTDFIDYLNKGDVLVLNNTKVIPARLIGHRETGAEIEIFLLKPHGDKNMPVWNALLKRAKRLRDNEIITVSDKLKVRIIDKKEGTVELLCDGVYKNIEAYGKIPLPPYINRENIREDTETYQTVFAQELGSVAAPTAGLHFTKEYIKEIEKKGVKVAYITLEVGLGTFLPVKCENILEHKMHSEKFVISKETANTINNCTGLITAVGTTVTRALETAYKKYGKVVETKEETDIFIYPPYEFKVIDRLLTNFHLPKSTLLMLVSAFSTKENIFKAYKEAIENQYRFFSYGDCMLLY